MTPAEKLAAAIQDATDAEALATALEQSVIDGDDSITAEEVASRRDLARFAALRVEAAKRAQGVADAEQTRAEIVQLGEEVLAHASLGTGRYVAAAHAAYEALRVLYDLAAERDNRHRSLTEQIRDAADRAPDVLARHSPIRPFAGGLYAGGFAVDTPDGRREVRHRYPAHALLAVTAAALEASCRPAEHDAIELHAALVFDAVATFAEMPELAPSPDWRRTF